MRDTELNSKIVGFPDYANATSVTWIGETTYTAPYDCWIASQNVRSSTCGSGASIAVNGKVMLVNNANNDAFGLRNVLFPVKKGDVVTTNQFFLGNMYIIPVL